MSLKSEPEIDNSVCTEVQLEPIADMKGTYIRYAGTALKAYNMLAPLRDAADLPTEASSVLSDLKEQLEILLGQDKRMGQLEPLDAKEFSVKQFRSNNSKIKSCFKRYRSLSRNDERIKQLFEKNPWEGFFQQIRLLVQLYKKLYAYLESYAKYKKKDGQEDRSLLSVDAVDPEAVPTIATEKRASRRSSSSIRAKSMKSKSKNSARYTQGSQISEVSRQVATVVSKETSQCAAKTEESTVQDKPLALSLEEFTKEICSCYSHRFMEARDMITALLEVLDKKGKVVYPEGERQAARQAKRSLERLLKLFDKEIGVEPELNLCHRMSTENMTKEDKQLKHMREFWMKIYDIWEARAFKLVRKNSHLGIKSPIEQQDSKRLRDILASLHYGTKTLEERKSRYSLYHESGSGHEEVTDKEGETYGFWSKSRKMPSIVTRHSHRIPTYAELDQRLSYKTGGNQQEIDQLYDELASQCATVYSAQLRSMCPYKESTSAQNSKPNTASSVTKSSFS